MENIDVGPGKKIAVEIGSDKVKNLVVQMLDELDWELLGPHMRLKFTFVAYGSYEIKDFLNDVDRKGVRNVGDSDVEKIKDSDEEIFYDTVLGNMDDTEFHIIAERFDVDGNPMTTEEYLNLADKAKEAGIGKEWE